MGAAAVVAGYGGYSFLGNKSAASADAPSTKKEAEKLDKRAFTGGDQGFIDLKLKEAKDYNHNTKRFVFELPEADQLSGMNVACESIHNACIQLTNNRSRHHHEVQSCGSRKAHHQAIHSHQ